MSRKRDFRRITRGLRFRLTASYALLFALLLTGVALLFRARLANTLETQVEEDLNQKWAAMKGYMRIERNTELGGSFVRTLLHLDGEQISFGVVRRLQERQTAAPTSPRMPV